MTEALAAQVALSTLTERERASAVVYLDGNLVETEQVVDAGGVGVRAEWPAYLVFVDLAPKENWGHACRYVLVRADSSAMVEGSGRAVENLVVDAQFPPFLRGVPDSWSVASVGSGVPEWTLATQRRLGGGSAI